MAVTPARLGKLRLNAGRLNLVAPQVPHTPTPPHLSKAGPISVQWLGYGNAFDVYFGATATPPLVGTTASHAWVVPPLTNGVTYFWKIVAKANSLGPAAIGPVWQFTAAGPSAPLYISPANHAINQPTQVTLSWSQPALEAGTVYDVYFGTTPHPAVVQRRQSTTTYTTTGLKDGIDYYWRIVAINNGGETSGPTWTFETRNPTKGLITIGGIDVRARTRIAGVSVRDLLADTPNTAAFTIEGTAPKVGQEVRIGLATLTGDDVLFGGYIDTVEALYEGRPENRAWRITAQDYVYGINRRKVRTRYSQQSATLIAQDLLTNWAPAGYTGTHIVAGLPIVNGGIDFTEEDLTACFARLAARIGGYWYVDYAKDVHLFLTESSAAPTPITRAARVLLADPPIHWSTDLSQIRTRVYVEGGGSQARSLVAVGATSLPVTDASWYSPSGGLVVSGPQRIRYTGKGTVGGPAKPSAVGQSIPGALGGGPYSYVVTQITAGAEGPLSAPSTPVSLPAVAAPPQTLQISASFSGVAAPQPWAAVAPFLSGVAPPSTAVNVAFVSTAIAAPTSAPVLAPISTQVAPPSQGMNDTPALPMTGVITSNPGLTNLRAVDVGTGTMHTGQATSYAWTATYYNARGDGPTGSVVTLSVPGSPCNGEMTNMWAIPTGQGISGVNYWRSYAGQWRKVGSNSGGIFKDTTPNNALSPIVLPPGNTSGTPGGGGLTPGTYTWRTVFVTSNGDTNTGPSNTITLPNSSPYYTAVQLSAVPTSGDGRVTARRIYRTKVNGSTFYLETTISDNVTTAYLSSKPDAQLGAVLDDTNRSGTGKLTPGASYGWAVTYATSSGETTSGPGTAYALAATHDTVDLSQVPISPDGRVTKRKIYRTPAGGGAYKLEATLNDNATTTYRSSAVSDAALGAVMPTSNTSGTGGLVPGDPYLWAVTFVTAAGETPIGPNTPWNPTPAGMDQAQLSAIPIGSSQVIARRIYRTFYNGSAYTPWQLVTTVNDNVTTTYLDTKTTAQLGAQAPSANTTGGGGLVPGMAYAWTYTYVTASGETTTDGQTGWITMPANCDMAALSAIPTSPDARVTKRKLYRISQSGDWQWRLEATINDNVTTTFTSSKTDGALGAAGLPPANTTGSGNLTAAYYAWSVKYVTASGESGEMPGVGFMMPAGTDTALLEGVPVSPDGRVTKRRIYRSNNAVTYKFEQDIADNVTTTAISTKADSALGADMVSGNTTSAGGQIAVSAIAVGGGTTTARKLYRTESGGAAYKLAAIINDNTTTTYQDNKSDASLGALAPVDLVTELIGIPASGAGSIRYEIRLGDDVNIFVQCDDTAAQTALAALEGAPSQGIVEHVLQDRRLGLAEATATGLADLALFARPLITIQYATRDPKTRSGKSVRIDLPELSLVGDFTIQTVEIDEIDMHPGLQPQYRVTCSSVRFSFEDAVRRFRLDE